MDELAQAFANSRQSVVVAAAGCGKTELIVRAAGTNTNGKQLILTHTNAGVRALLDRLKRRHVPTKSVQVDTIDGWAMRYASAFPSLSGLKVANPSSPDFEWEEVHGAALDCIKRRSVADVVARSFTGLYVDEYQDCTVDQHDLILRLAELVPCRIVGDPLQGIFDFTKRAVRFNTHVTPNFETIGELGIPHRWNTINQELGQWLGEVRQLIINGDPIDLRNGPVDWHKPERPNQIAICKSLLNNKGESVVAIGLREADCCKFASSLGGRYDNMETIECRPLMEAARGLDSPCGRERTLAMIDFAEKCFTAVKTPLKSTREAYLNHKMPRFKKGAKHSLAKTALARVFESPGEKECLAAMKAIEETPDAKLYRKELWWDMKRTLQESLHSDSVPLCELAWNVRDKGRRIGRKVHGKTVSRTLLIKGLEFDHAVILDADKLDAKNLYVAITRGTKSLTVFSARPVIRKTPPG